jgi:hypothetical protein
MRTFLGGARGRPLQKFGRLDLEHGSKLADYFEADVTATFFQLAHVGPVNAGFIRQAFLRKALRVPQAPEVRSEDLAQIHAPSEKCRRLLTHRFKATKLVTRAWGVIMTRRLARFLVLIGNPPLKAAGQLVRLERAKRSGSLGGPPSLKKFPLLLALLAVTCVAACGDDSIDPNFKVGELPVCTAPATLKLVANSFNNSVAANKFDVNFRPKDIELDQMYTNVVEKLPDGRPNTRYCQSWVNTNRGRFNISWYMNFTSPKLDRYVVIVDLQ